MTKIETIIATTPLTSYEKKCAAKLAHAFYDYAPEWQKDLPPFKDVLAMAKEVIHEENITEELRDPNCMLDNSDIPLMPAIGFDYIGVEYYFDKNDEVHYMNLKASLEACLKSTYYAWEENRKYRK